MNSNNYGFDGDNDVPGGFGPLIRTITKQSQELCKAFYKDIFTPRCKIQCQNPISKCFSINFCNAFMQLLNKCFQLYR